MTKRVKTIREKTCETAEEFLEELSPTNRVWFETFGPTFTTSGWAFRGQADASWALKPSAHRGELEETVDGQREAEQERVLHFREIADRAGLTIDPLVIPSEEHNWDRAIKWPPKEYYAIWAHAQHYGIPTRLLDWSYSQYVAAYFAARAAAKSVKEAQEDACPYCGKRRAKGEHVTKLAKKRIAVWAVNINYPDHLEDVRKETGKDLKIDFVRVTAPYADNPNLAAQQGLFTLVRNRGDYEGRTVIPPFLDQSPELEDAAKYDLLCKVTLSYLEAPKLLRLLDIHGFHAAALFPTYDGASMRIRDGELFDTQDGMRWE
ncbi:MAG: FRG domain-containing protein [Planctomycetota bacterium]|jgi:hypothetical protein